MTGQHEFSVSEALAAALLRSAGIRTDGLHRVQSHGTVNAMYRAGDVVVRMPFSAGGGESIRAEAAWLPRIAEALPVPVPRLLHVGEPTEAYPSPWLVLDWLDGAPARGGTGSPQLADALADVVLALHAMPLDGAAPAERGGPLRDHDGLVRWGLAQRGGMLPAEARDRWEAALAAPRAADEVLAHTDLLPGNVLVDGDRLVGVIDWGAMGAADPATDALAAWSIFTGDARERHLARLGLDEAALLRAEGWAMVESAVALPYNLDTNPGMVEVSRRVLAELGLPPRLPG